VTASTPEHTGLRRILHSYRWRRRFVIWGTLFVVAGIIAALAAISVHNPSSAAHGGPATIVGQPKHAPFTPAEKSQVHKVLADFLSTAVAREHIASAWRIVGPDLRSGLTKREWDTGAIPVQPYPVANRGLGKWQNVEYSNRNAVGLSVLLFPKPGSGQAPATADVDVIKHHGRWLVNYFMPNKYHGNPLPAKKTRVAAHPQERLSEKARRAQATKVALPAEPPRPHANRLYWAVPIGIFALVILTPLVVFGVTWFRNKRAYNSYPGRGAQ
jgi:hypothetical protein